MKKVLILLAFVAIASTNCFAYGFGIDSPEYPEYQNSATMWAGTNYIMYSIFVYQGAGCISSDSFGDSLVNYDGQSQKYGDYSGFCGDVCLVACNLGQEDGYCRIIAWW